MKYLFSIFSLLMLSSCSSRVLLNPENSVGYYPPSGSKLVVHEAIQVGSDKAGAYIQEGMNRGGAHSRFKPYCYIRFINVKQTPQVINPDTFYITSSHIETRLVASQQKILTPYGPVSYRLAYNTPSDILEVVTMRISSKNQPSVYLLECGGVENQPAEVEPPTISDIRHAMGGIMSVRLP